VIGRRASAAVALLAVAAAAAAQAQSQPQPTARTQGQAQGQATTESQAEAPAPAPTQLPVFQPGLAVSAVATDNAQLSPDSARVSDFIGQVSADLRARLRGARVTLTGDIGADFIGYARDEENSSVLPRGRLDLTSILVERALYFDAGVEASRQRGDPFAPQGAGPATANTISTVTWRASPYFQHDFSPTVAALVRSDTIATKNNSDTSSITPPGGSTVQREIARIERKPVPVGLALEASREETTYQSGATPLTIDSARATVSVGVDQELLFGVVGGYDHAVYGITNDEALYGITTQWRPSVRTQLDADIEHRFFGTGWNIHFRDRLPLTVIDLSWNRGASGTPASIGLPAADSDPAALLNSLLSSRIPGTSARDSAVDELTESRGLPTAFARPIDVFAETPQVAQTFQLDVLANGVRDSLLGSLFYSKAELLPGATASSTTSVPDSRQWGGSLGLFHRMTPNMAAGAELTYSDVEAIGTGPRSGDASREWIATLSLTRRINKQATLACGVRHLSAHVTLASTDSAYDVDENQVFAGLRMQY
jgi:uncharacterized protein (PEP-CTERM system associated)